MLVSDLVHMLLRYPPSLLFWASRLPKGSCTTDVVIWLLQTLVYAQISSKIFHCSQLGYPIMLVIFGGNKTQVYYRKFSSLRNRLFWYTKYCILKCFPFESRGFMCICWINLRWAYKHYLTKHAMRGLITLLNISLVT